MVRRILRRGGQGEDQYRRLPFDEYLPQQQGAAVGALLIIQPAGEMALADVVAPQEQAIVGQHLFALGQLFVEVIGKGVFALAVGSRLTMKLASRAASVAGSLKMLRVWSVLAMSPASLTSTRSVPRG